VKQIFVFYCHETQHHYILSRNFFNKPDIHTYIYRYIFDNKMELFFCARISCLLLFYCLCMFGINLMHCFVDYFCCFFYCVAWKVQDKNTNIFQNLYKTTFVFYSDIILESGNINYIRHYQTIVLGSLDM
jgi:hypothetical protein